ncbi:MAG: mandelate racemase/muconate lactonizing enzyme family protein [Anaerolineae bacterium]|nr:mandelate racemase/muconate lactonizing enzyme family protein [Anaerolineae bacterium]
MKIKNIQTIALGCDGGVVGFLRGFCLVRVETDAGIVGYGEASTSYGHIYPNVVEAIVDAAIAPAIMGKDPLDIRSRVHDMKLYIHPWLGWEGISAQVIGAVEIALWDILGKVKEMPICHLFGAHRDKIPLYGTGTVRPMKEGEDPKWHGKYFKELLDSGFQGIKTRISSGIEPDVAQVAAVRDYIGPGVRLMVDGYFCYTPSTAIKLAKAIAEYDIYWLEEPIPQHMLPGLARLHEESPVPIAYGERTYSLSGFEILINRRAVDILQPDVAVCGGLIECIEIDALAKAHNLKVFPHIGGLSAVGLAANLHLASIIKSEMLEYDGNPYQPLRDELLKDPIFSWDRVEDGCLKVPDGPGLGIEIDESAFEKFPFKKGKFYPDVYPQFGLGYY